MNPPATPPLLRDLNERTVLETIRDRAPISRAEISRRVGISKPTVSVALAALLEAGLVRETETDREGPKYGATFFEPVPEAALVLGLDLGARFLRGAVCDLRGTVRAREDVELPGADIGRVLDAAAELRSRLLVGRRPSGGRARRRGRRRPGRRSRRRAGRSASPPNIPGLEGLRIGPALQERLGLPVTVENDVSLARGRRAVARHRRRGGGLRVPVGRHGARLRARAARRAAPRPPRRRRRGRLRARRRFGARERPGGGRRLRVRRRGSSRRAG